MARMTVFATRSWRESSTRRITAFRSAGSAYSSLAFARTRALSGHFRTRRIAARPSYGIKPAATWERHRVPRKQRVIPTMTGTQQSLLARTPSQPWRTVRDVLSGLPDPDATGSIERLSLITVSNLEHEPTKDTRAAPFDGARKTLKAGVHGVPGGENMLCRPDGSVRYFTVREAARLQTFPMISVPRLLDGNHAPAWKRGSGEHRSPYGQ